MLQIVSEALAKSGQIFPADAGKTLTVERLKKIVMSASSAAFKAFKKNVTPQLKLMAPAFRLNVRIPPVEQPAYSAEFFGVAVEKYYYNYSVQRDFITFENLFTSHFLEAENSCIILYYLDTALIW